MVDIAIMLTIFCPASNILGTNSGTIPNIALVPVIGSRFERGRHALMDDCHIAVILFAQKLRADDISIGAHMSDPTPPGQPLPAADSEGEPPVRKLLYVEDQPANMILVELLVARRTNWKFLKAVNGNLAILMAKANKPEVILLDINLPDISGYDVLRILREDPALLSIPVIALSSNAFPNDIAKGIHAGFFRYLTKPYHINE